MMDRFAGAAIGFVRGGDSADFLVGAEDQLFVKDGGHEIPSADAAGGRHVLRQTESAAIVGNFAVDGNVAVGSAGSQAAFIRQGGTTREEPQADARRPDGLWEFEAGFGAPAPMSLAPAGAAAGPVSQPGLNAPNLPTDEHFAQQYYLRNTAAGGRDLHMFHGDRSVWDEFTGRGVRVGVIDDGVDLSHSDLDGNHNPAWALPGSDGSPPGANDSHGTAVAGIIVAERNGSGVVGIAYDARFASMAAIAPSGGPSYSQAIANYANFDVINNSWGGGVDFNDALFNPEGRADRDMLATLSANGRGGLGTIFVKSAGNERAEFGNASSSYNNTSPYSITVAAAQRDGFVSDYSCPGSSVLVTAFGGPTQGADVWTTDRTGDAGYGAGDYTGGFNGTSAAAPMVTGVVALMLQANPNLGYRDVQTILAATAQHGGSAIGGGPAGHEAHRWKWNGATNWNGGAMHYSEDYGFGLVDAFAAVRLAESWRHQSTQANRLATSANMNEAARSIPDGGSTDITFDIAAGISVERINLDLGMSHSRFGDLKVQLISPTGTVSEIFLNHMANNAVPDFGPYDLNVSSTAFLGENAGGRWTLRFIDDVAGNAGQIEAARLHVTGGGTVNDTYVYTEEFSTYGAPAGRRTLNDTDGGLDEVNTSAVFGNIVIDLRVGGVSTIDGLTVTTSGATIENVATGDGNDIIHGNLLNNLIRGGRGNDTAFGYRGNDRFFGGAGDDRFEGGRGSDTFVGGEGFDTAVLRGLAGAKNAILNYGGTVYALDFRDKSRDALQTVESFTDGLATIGLGQVKAFSNADTLAYAASHNDLALAFRTNGMAAAFHYIDHGYFEGRKSFFSADQYLINHADLRSAFGTNQVAATHHFLNFGVNEKRLAEDPLDYLASFTDLRNAFAGQTVDQARLAGLSHYQSNGYNEGRRGGILFDAKSYLANQGDVRNAFGGNDDLAAWHFINWGAKEGRLWENPLGYVAAFSDLINAFKGLGSAAAIAAAGVDHFRSSGFTENRRAGIGSFDVGQYLANYGDLRQAFANGQGGYNEEAATLHFIQAGFSEGRVDDVLSV
ncbi:MAG TPA: S8 family serine peptidase [Mesorhizobium sp.]|jgi:subtilisin-like proprotein convertase family protein|nr:S8 family serine peptidase [Mesorhizobium sp.]